MNIEHLLKPVTDFLHCDTPQAWIDMAKRPEHLSVVLRDHMVCELKAAQTAMLLIRKYAVDDASSDALLEWLKPYEDFTYRKKGQWQDLANCNTLKKTMIPRAQSPENQDLIDKMVLLIKEELHHFYQVLEMMQVYGVEYEYTTSSRYAKTLLSHMRTHEPAALVDKLICGAYIEARSCERFARLAPHVDPQLGEFYISLLRSEARHYQDYLSLAQSFAKTDISDRIAYFGGIEAKAITDEDDDFKFHSGTPAQALRVA
jgi:tRNA-(ms[2]io[6]A)-hydroxylase